MSSALVIATLAASIDRHEGIIRPEDVDRWASMLPGAGLSYDASFDGSRQLQELVVRGTDGVVLMRRCYAGRWCRLADDFFADGRPMRLVRNDEFGKSLLRESYNPDGSLRQKTETRWSGVHVDELLEVRDGVEVLRAVIDDTGYLQCALFDRRGALIARGAIDDPVLTGEWVFFGADEVEEVRVDFDESMSTDLLQLSYEEVDHVCRVVLSELVDLVIPDELDSARHLDWSSYETANGYDFAGVVTLSELVCDVTLLRDMARQTVESAAFSGRTPRVSGVAAPLVPYLVTLLGHPIFDEHMERDELWNTVYSIARAAGFWLESIHRERGEGVLAAADLAVGEAFDSEREALSHLYQYGGLSPADRAGLLSLLLSLSSVDDRTVEATEVAKDEVESPECRAVAAYVLCGSPSMGIEDIEWLALHDDPLTRMVAAMELSKRFAGTCPVAVIEAVSSSISARSELAAQYESLPFDDPDYRVDLTAGLGQVGAYAPVGSPTLGAARALLPQLLELMTEVGVNGADSFAATCLSLALGRGDGPFAESFVEVLRAIAENEDFWTFNVNASQVLGNWNLPPERDALVELVSKLEAVDAPEATLRLAIE